MSDFPRGLPSPAGYCYSSAVATTEDVRAYWQQHIHDLEITQHPVGSRGFFDDLDEYHFDKLHHLLRLVDFEGWRGRAVLEVGCGAGVDLARFAKGGAAVTGVDLTESAIALARTNFAQQTLEGRFEVADAEHLPLADASFDLVYAHGVVQYTAHPERLVEECYRVLKPGGQAIFQVYNRVSWLNALSKLMKVGLEHDDAPVLLKFSAKEFRALLTRFRDVRLVAERFPVKSRLHGGWKGAVYNGLFVGAFNMVPRPLVRRFGWHLLAFCTK
jgi:ubiquinone/menaquinone biosynthesis C-methylase UbiE